MSNSECRVETGEPRYLRYLRERTDAERGLRLKERAKQWRDAAITIT